MRARAMHLQSISASRPGARAQAYLATPNGWLFVIIAVFLLFVLATGARNVPLLLDQDNYLQYFRRTTWEWFVRSYDERTSTLAFAISTITEEFGWRMWVVGLNSLGFSPETGVRITVVMLNALIFVSLLEVRRPLVGLLLWAIVPMALATVGLFQIRQGMAFSIAMLFSLRYQKPVTGWLLAAFVHTTFAVPALLFLAMRPWGNRRWMALASAATVAVVLVSTAGFLFKNFGGRRIDEYAGYQNDFTIKLVILLVVYMTAAVLVLYTEWKTRPSTKQEVWKDLCMMDVTLVLYLVLAFVLFPFGKGRVWYCVPLLLPYMIGQMRFKNRFVVWWTVGILLVLSAEVLKSYYEDVYAYFLG